MDMQREITDEGTPRWEEPEEKPKDIPKYDEGFWRTKGENGEPKLIPIDEMEDEHFIRAYFYMLKKAIHTSKLSLLFISKSRELEEEAKRRGINLAELEEAKTI